ncbi:MAG TPA: serine hydrolase domain-containing protein [Candidatus Limnocylindria bacterium]|nr:serine hydrolase domain-containing protein [Candidatus Limnocylindria bacterium]
MTTSFFRHGLLGITAALALGSLTFGAELPVVKPEQVGLSAAKLDGAGQIVEDLIRSNRLAGATIAVVRHGKVAYFKAFGKRNIEAKTPMTEDTIFRIFSMSKGIATAGALVLVDEGKLELDAPVSKYIPEFKDPKVWSPEGVHPAKREPTVRDLMRHTAGLTYGGGEGEPDRQYRLAKILDRDVDLQTMCAALGKIPLAYEPGTQWQYSVSVDVLGRVIEVASGMPFDEFLQKRIFTPLDMKDTGFYVPAEKASRFASSYFSDGKGGLKLQDAPGSSQYLTKPRFLSGGGGLVSTTRDYVRFIAMVQGAGKLHGVRILKPKTADLMTHNNLPDEAMPIRFGKELRDGVGFGLGFNVRVASSDKWDPAGPVGEYGWGGAASTHYWVSPKDDLIVVTMEQTMPYAFMLEWALKGPIYQAVKR